MRAFVAAAAMALGLVAVWAVPGSVAGAMRRFSQPGHPHEPMATCNEAGRKKTGRVAPAGPLRGSGNRTGPASKRPAV